MINIKIYDYFIQNESLIKHFSLPIVLHYKWKYNIYTLSMNESGI